MKTVARICLTACALVLALAASAQAATGSFPWTVTMTHQVNSRNWTQTSGSTVIVSNLKCWGNDAVSTYKIQLFKNNTFSDTAYTKVTYTCGVSQRYTWTNLPKGTFHFTISKATDGRTATGSGSVTYPSN